MSDSHLQHELGQHLREELLAGRISRREFLRSATAFGLSAGAIAALLAGGGRAPALAQTPPVKRAGTIRVHRVLPIRRVARDGSDIASVLELPSGAWGSELSEALVVAARREGLRVELQ